MTNKAGVQTNAVYGFTTMLLRILETLKPTHLAVAFIPPSLPRAVQFMNEFAVGLNLTLPQINLVKARTGQVVVAQKTLEKLEERVANARETIFVKDQKFPYKKVLLIDDAVGSGASMNEVAKKINAKVYGFAVVGSFKGFEVIREV